MTELGRRKIHEQAQSIGASILGVILGLLFGLLVLLIANPRYALPGFLKLLVSPLQNGSTNIGSVFYYATTYIFCALSVAFCGVSGVFNIGVTGQFIAGSFVACYMGVTYAELPPAILIPLTLLCSTAAGFLCGAVLGALKAFFSISEVVVGILMNYILLYACNIFITATIFDPYGNRTLSIGENAVIPRMGFDKLFANTGVDMSLPISILVALIIYFILQKTTFGYEIKFAGYNRDAAHYAGINSKKIEILAVAIGGALPALAGAFWHLSSAGNYMLVVDVQPTAPMNGMSASLLALGNPIGCIFASIFVAYITVGGFNLQVYGYVPEIVSVVTGAIIYCSAFVALLRVLIIRVGGKIQLIPPRKNKNKEARLT